MQRRREKFKVEFTGNQHARADILINRRRFLQTLAIAASTPASSIAANRKSNHDGFGKLIADPDGMLDLPAGFSYTVLARAGETMSDGLLIPGEADGMAAFPGDDGDIILVCNHENGPEERGHGPFGLRYERLDRIDRERMYDFGGGSTPGLGGTTTIIYDPLERRTRRQYLSLAGTEINCAGGPTPWGSWLSCEETFSDSGPAFEYGQVVMREQKHGYVFEVPANASGPVAPVPLKDMGRFEHEAAAVNPASGVVYLTEDRHRSLLYRYLPTVPGELHRGGRLQALAVAGRPSFDTRNWAAGTHMQPWQWHESGWIDLEDVDNIANDLRLRGYADGAARFARGEGLCYADGSLFMTCTIGGPERLGQVFEYRLSPADGAPGEREDPGQLRLIAESRSDSLLRHADNITMSPWGDLVICEDTADHCGLVGITPDGRQYPLADNAYTISELAGICFSPDDSVMFVNIQHDGLTLAISGPWSSSG